MTVSNANNTVTYTGDTVSTIWPYTFYVIDATHMVVTLIDVATGTESAALSASLYSITGIDVQTGGSVTYPLTGSPLDATKKIKLTRTVPFTQSVSINNEGGFLQEVVEEGLDALEMQIQQINADIVALNTAIIQQGNVPSPVLGDIGKFLKATATGIFAWSAIVASNISDATAAGISMLKAADAAAQRVLLGLGTAALLTAGVAAGNVVVLDGSARLPAVDGSLLTGIGASTCFDGRLTLTTATPVLTGTVTGATTVYYTQYRGQACSIYNGTSFASTDLGGELSNVLANAATGKAGPAACTTNSNYDFFIWNDAGTPRLTRGPLWTSDTARGTGAGTSELVRVKGVMLNANAITNGPAAQRGTYVGSIRTNGTSTCDYQFGALGANGTAGIVGVWNMYNRVNISMFVQDSTDSWTNTSATIRAANASNTMRVSFISGLAEDGLSATYKSTWDSAAIGRTAMAGIGFNSTTAIASGSTSDFSTAAVVATKQGMVANYQNAALFGFNYVQALEAAPAGTVVNFYGDNVTPTTTQTGLSFNFRA